MEILGKLFGSVARVKLMKLFLFNPENIFDNATIAERSKVTASTVRREAGILEAIGMVKRKVAIKEVGKRKERRRVPGWVLASDFKYLGPLQQLLLNTDSLHPDDIVEKLNRTGKIKLVAVSGIFMQQIDSRLDILIVGDKLRMGSVENALRNMEAEIGKELKYAALETTDFLYRLNVYDKLVRDVFDYPHRKIVNKLGLK